MGALKALAKAAEAAKRVNRVAEYVDKPAHNLQDWEWKPLSVPAAIVNAKEVPDYIQKGYGDFMIKQAGRAAQGDLNKRDLIKAYGITQSSIGRKGLKHSTATKAGLQAPNTGGLVRPEGAFAEWLASPMGQRYLNEAELGNTDLAAVNDIVQKFRPFGKFNELGKALVYGADVLGRDPRDINAMITGDKEAFRDYAKSIYGIDQAKAGFIGSLLGRGDLPTLDARQLSLHTNPPTTVKVVGSIMNRQKGKGAKEAVDRLIDRQEAMALDLDPSLDPFYQHLTHHTAWDRALNEITTHDDLIRAMQNYNEGGEVHAAGGGALKALGALAKTAKAAQDVLPAAEREENLRKFLSRSQLPDRLYHATATDFKAFKPGGFDPELSGPATWLTNTPGYQPAYHNTRGKGKEEFRSGTQVMPVHVNAPRVMLIDNPEMHSWAKEVYGRGLPYTLSKEQAEAIKKDYDAVHYADPYGRNESHEILVFDPNRIKSAIGNRGTYDINESDMTKASGGDVHMAGGGPLKALGALGRAAKDLATSDAAYNLANKVAKITGAAPMQIMMGPNSKTWNHGNAALAEHMERQGKSPEEIWKATGTFRAADGRLRQEISDADMKYISGTVEKKQYESAKKRYEQAKARATTPEEVNDANDYWNKTKTNAIFNLTGKAQDFIEHPELFAAYPDLAKYTFKQLEPTHSQFTAPETVQGFYSPGSQRITINTDAPYKRSTALHELQHAIQEIEGWQGGSSPEYVAAKMAERDVAKKEAKEIQDRIDNMKAMDPVLYEDLIRHEQGALGQRQYLLNQTKELEGEADPYNAYRKISGEEEARMVQARRNMEPAELSARPPFEDYETDPSQHITGDFAAGGEVHAAGGGLVQLIRGAQDLKNLAKRTDRIAGTLISGGMREEQAFNKAREMAAQTILEEKFMPPEHPTAPPISSKEIAEHAERVAKQVNGEYMNKEQAGRETTGKSQRQFKREKNLQADVRQNISQPEPQVVDYNNHIGSMIVGVPGDATLGGLIRFPDDTVIGTHELHGVNGISLDEPIQLYGGPHYGLGHENSFWASNEGPARGIQNLIQQLGEEYPVLGQYVKMGPGSEAFAMHNLQALMGVLKPERLSRAQREALAEHVNAMRGKEWDKPKKDKPRSADFVGFKDPEALLAQAEKQSDLRKVIAQILSGPNEGRSKMAGFGLPSGADVVTAITHPELRNIEQGASGFAIGKMNPNSGLTPGLHPTYEKDIPGEFIGRSAHPIPYDLAFPDTAAYLKYRQTYLPEDTGHFPLFKMQMGRQKITDQYVNQIDEYLRRMKQLTGRKKGGEVEKDE